MREHGFVTAFKNALAVENLSVRKAARIISSNIRTSRRRIEAVSYNEMPLTFETFMIMKEGAAQMGINIRYDALDFYKEEKAHYGIRD